VEETELSTEFVDDFVDEFLKQILFLLETTFLQNQSMRQKKSPGSIDFPRLFDNSEEET